MPLNVNPWVNTLLAWHGHDSGGVRVPFRQELGSPLRRAGSEVIETRLIRKLCALASALANGEPVPRILFLVGGPGNGKSEAVEACFRCLDEELGLGGKLLDTLGQKYKHTKLLPWLVAVEPHEVDTANEVLSSHVGRIEIVQDASASESPAGDAARALVDKLKEILSAPRDPPRLFVCCINRGVLARCKAIAARDEQFQDVELLATRLSEATSVSKPSSDSTRVWPLQPLPESLDGLVACWPMDMESLLLQEADGGLPESPVGEAFRVAVSQPEWEVTGRCADCDSRRICPFRQNASWLRDHDRRGNMLHVLRMGELAAGQRWNFRDTFSLVAELLVGERGDFGDEQPCEWVHRHAAECREPTSEARRAMKASRRLLGRLYPHALFPVPLTASLPAELRKIAHSSAPVTRALDDEERASARPATTYIRALLRERFAPRVDPALLSPHDDSPLAEIEEGYSTSIGLGNQKWGPERPALAERVFLRAARAAEGEWDLHGRDFARAFRAIVHLRALGCRVAKRSVAVRRGIQGGGALLEDYARLLRDEELLDGLRDGFRALLGKTNFRADAVETYGQPRREANAHLTLAGPPLRIKSIQPAPRGSDETPAHDLPSIHVGKDETVVPLTYELFLALELRRAGVAGGSLPPSTQAAVDRIRHLHAGTLCRRTEDFAAEDARYEVGGIGRITAKSDGTPRFRPGT